MSNLPENMDDEKISLIDSEAEEGEDLSSDEEDSTEPTKNTEEPTQHRIQTVDTRRPNVYFRGHYKQNYFNGYMDRSQGNYSGYKPGDKPFFRKLPVHLRLGMRKSSYQYFKGHPSTFKGKNFNNRSFRENRFYYQKQETKPNDVYVPPSNPIDKIGAAALENIEDINKRITAQRISDVFGSAHQALLQPIPNGGFRPSPNSPWLAALEFGKDTFTLDGRRVTWETLMMHGHELYKMFEIRSHASEAARALRSSVLRGESLMEALASADETLIWCKLIAEKNLPIRTNDPIIATTRALFDNLKLKLEPFMECYLKTKELKSLKELCCDAKLADVTCIPTFMFITLERIAKAVESGCDVIDYDIVSGSNRVLEEYTPGACLAGILEAIDSHKNKCKDSTCNLICGSTIMPMYLHGKYFYCNSLF
ncbi:multifunctional expression regulator [Canid alphaherpesvirus 1]|nr:multifunctional expression regulator [Canid alphaherpesvirus 1]